MVRECFINKTGILFHSTELEEIGLSPDTLWPEVRTPILPTKENIDTSDSGYRPQPADTTAGSGSGYTAEASKTTPLGTSPDNLTASIQNSLGGLAQSEEAKDAMSPIYDKLVLSKFWRFMELFPTRRRYQYHKSWWAMFS
jgi:hypothetical protein